MQTGYPAREIAGERLDWFTYEIEPDGPRSAPSARPADLVTVSCLTGVLDRRTSQLLQVLLNEIAQDNAIPFPQARQAVLRALRRAHNRRRPTE